MKNKNSMIKFFSLLLMGAFLFSCEQIIEVDDVVDVIKEEQEARIFTVNLQPLNNSGVTGEATIQYIRDGKFQTHIMAENLAPNVAHPQHIHGFGVMDAMPKKAICPPMSAAGDDGLLTLQEGLPFYGPVLIPLDSELTPLTQQKYPRANKHGQVNYLEYTELTTLITEIDMANEGTQSLRNLALDKRVIVIHGAYVKDNMVVPEGTEGAEYMAALPVACGEIVEVY